MRRLLLLYFAVLFIFSVWIFAVEFGSEEGLVSEEAVTVEDKLADSVASGASLDEQISSHGHQAEASEEETASRKAKQLVVRQSVDEQSSSFMKPYLQLGYKTVYDAVKDCELRFMQQISLPIYTPSLAFTHQLGKCHMNFDDQDGLEINYLHEHIPAQRYMILIRPLKHRVEFPATRIIDTYTLQDESEAMLSVTPDGGYDVLSFEQDSWQYLLIVSKHPELTPEELVKAANSMRTYSEDKVW